MRFSKIILIVTVLIFSGNSIQAKKEKTVPKRETVEWLDVWMPHTNDNKLPRVLLIGNSITRGYYPKVEKLLRGKAYVARLTTSKSLGDPALIQEINLIMGYYKFDLIHFNNGLHGWEYSEKEYDEAFPGMIKAIQKNAPDAKLIWATTTPIRTGKNCEQLEKRVARIITRNQIAQKHISKEKNIKTNDLFNLILNHPEYFSGGDGVHPIDKGYQVLAEQVAKEISEFLTQ
ncbi:SGNH/GDSL hydrolase family protein [Coprobacter sp.]